MLAHSELRGLLTLKCRTAPQSNQDRLAERSKRNISHEIQTWANAKFCTWDRLTPCSGTGWGLASWEQLSWKGPDTQANQEHAQATRKATNTLDCSNRSITSRLSELTLPLCSVLLRSHLGEGSTSYKKAIDNWRGFCKVQHLLHEEWLKELGLFGPEERRFGKQKSNLRSKQK